MIKLNNGMELPGEIHSAPKFIMPEENRDPKSLSDEELLAITEVHNSSCNCQYCIEAYTVRKLYY